MKRAEVPYISITQRINDPNKGCVNPSLYVANVIEKRVETSLKILRAFLSPFKNIL